MHEVGCLHLELEPNNQDSASKPEAESNLKETCDACQKPLVKSTSGDVTTWLFKGLFCACNEIPAEPKETITTFFPPEGVDSWSPPPETANHEPLRFEFPSRKAVVNQTRKSVHQNIRLVPPAATFNLTEAGEDAEGADNKSDTAEETHRLAQSDPEKLIGKTLGQYRITAYIGNGSSGHLFKGHHETSRQIVAIKLITPAPSFGKRHNERILADARVAQKLENDKLLAVYDAGITDDQLPYIVTEFFEGKRLTDVLKTKGPLVENDAIKLFMQICEGLNHAHYMGVMHRDIRPNNIRIDSDDNVKVVDCGTSKNIPDPERETRYFTETGFEYGDARYMSPEQCRGAKTDYRSDIYSLGCLMYECLSGKTPFTAEKNSMLIYKHIKKRPRTLSTRFPDLQVSQDLENLVMRCLEKEPDDRYQSVSDLIDDLNTIDSRKQVKRAFRKKLQITPDKREQLTVAEMLSAAVSAVWFQASSTTRLLTLCTILTALISCSIFLVIERAKQPIFTPAANSWTQSDVANLIEAGELRIANLRKESEELLAALRTSKSELVPKAEELNEAIALAQARAETDNPGGQIIDRREMDLLERRLMLLKTESGADSITASNVIRDSQQATLYIAPAGTSKVDTLLAAIRNNADLTDANLSNANFEGISLTDANLNGANFSNSNLTGATLNGVDILSAKFDFANLDMINFVNVNASKAEFRSVSLRGATFANTNLEDAKFLDSNFSDSDIYGGNTKNLSIIQTDLSNAIMFDPGSTVDMDGTPVRKELTRLKTDCEKKLVRLANIANSLAILQQENVKEVLVSSADPHKNSTFTVTKTESIIPLEKSLDKALATCRTAVADARKLRRSEIVSSKASEKMDLKTGLKQLTEQIGRLNSEIGQVDNELLALGEKQGTTNLNVAHPGFRKTFIKKRNF